MLLVGRSAAIQSEGDVHQRALEELSGDVETVDMKSRWGWLWRCVQVVSRRDLCRELGRAVPYRRWGAMKERCVCCERPRPTDVLTLHWSVKRGCSAGCPGSLEMAKKEKALEASYPNHQK